jgi:signal transduction histidine kinase
MRTGLASDTVWSMTEDDLGRIYLCTGRGVNRLDPTTARIEHLTTADGLAGDLINQCITDRTGHIWIATSMGLSRFNPRADAAAVAPPPVYLNRVQIAGEDLELPETGALRIPRFTLPPASSSVVIEYGAPLAARPGAVRFQYRLDGVDREWSEPTLLRSVNYARLAAGAYRFAVRTVAPNGTAAGDAAVMEFEILPRFYRRAWFVAAAFVAVAALAVSVHRLRVNRLLAMDRIRQQIAADLHDDIGAGLAQVAILSEVARRDAAPSAGARLGQIAALARTMRDAMSDIVWAVDPGRDRLRDLVPRMREAALQTLTAHGVRVDFEWPAEDDVERILLSPDRRRHLLLILKEAVTNIARHAEATHVRIALTLDRGRLRLRIEDNGRGFDPQHVDDGHGLQSMSRRTHALGGEFLLRSDPGAGTTIDVRIPL